jgi:hypothetical protein
VCTRANASNAKHSSLLWRLRCKAPYGVQDGRFSFKLMTINAFHKTRLGKEKQAGRIFRQTRLYFVYASPTKGARCAAYLFSNLFQNYFLLCFVFETVSVAAIKINIIVSSITTAVFVIHCFSFLRQNKQPLCDF